MIVIQQEHLWIAANIALAIIGWAFLYLITVLSRFGDKLTTKSEIIWVTITGICPILYLLIKYGIIIIE